MSGRRMPVRVLGPVTLVGDDGPVAIGGALPRGFLTVLAVESPRPVSVDRLTSLLWGDSAPAGVKGALQQLATRVRRSMATVGLADCVRAVPPGYVLDVDPDEVDVRVFRAAVRTATMARLVADHDTVARELSDALVLWTDSAFVDLVDLPLAWTLAPGLDEERWRAEEWRAEALLATGRAAECVEVVSRATAEAPLRERLWVLQARALAAAGRPADAVRCVRTGIAVVAAELGVPPGPELASLEDELRSLPTTAAPALRLVPAITPRNALVHDALRRAMVNAEQAATAATARWAHGEAVRQWERALELLDAVDPDDDAHRLRILLGLGEAHNTASLAAEACAVFLQAVDVARRSGDGPGLAWAALGYCGDRIGFTPPSQQRELLEEALAGLDDDQSLLRGRILARLATERYWTDSVDGTLELAEQAFVEAARAGDDETRLLARYAMAFGCWTPDRTPRLVSVCETYLDDARTVGDRRHELLAHRWLVPAVTELGDIARGGREAQIAMDLADELELSEQQWISRVIAASHQLVVGDLARAEALATEGLALGSVSEPEVALDFVSLCIWTLRWLQGRLAEIVSLVEGVAATPGVDLARRLGLALTYGDLGRLADATKILDAVTPADVDALEKNASWFTSLAAMAEAGASTGHASAAAIALERLRPYHDRIAITSLTSTGPVAHHIGIAAWTVGDHALGRRALADAIDVADAIGAPVFGARSRLALAERLVVSGEGRRASMLAEAAHATSLAHSLSGVERRAAVLVAAS